MKVILFGASGMVGKGVLYECLEDASVEKVLSIGRSKIETTHPKLEQIEHGDFTNYASLENRFSEFDACFFCLGVSAAGLKEEAYYHITYNFTLEAARTMFRANPSMTFIYVSGQGTDSTEKGRMMWARVKGKTENDLLALGFKQAFMFRPGAIIPKKGIKSRTRAYQFMYDYFTWLLKFIKRIAPNSITDTVKLGKAMIHAHQRGYEKQIIDPVDINALAE